MVRNERDIIGPWLEHHLALFDHIVIADHKSDDGTYELLQAEASGNSKLRVLRYVEPSYDQDAVFNALKDYAAQNCDFEWLFVLDADEFLPFDGEVFRDEIGKIESYDVLCFNWRNCFLSGDALGVGYRSHDLSTYGKVALRRNIAEDKSYRIPKGAHRLTHSDMGSINGFEFGELLHFPVRSVDQIWRKTLQGCESYLHVPGYGGVQGRHWFEILNFLIKNPTRGWEIAPQIVRDYGRPPTAAPDDPLAGFEPSTFASLASTPPQVELREPTDLNERLKKIKTLDRRGLVDVTARIQDDQTIRLEGNFAGRHFSALPAERSQPISFETATDALQAAFLDIQHRPTTAWGEHIPFMFALMTLVKPRRYVELGVHNGASFLAACQAVQHNSQSCECVAIDNWVGDNHAGVHSDRVFTDFRRRLVERYNGFAGYLKMNFDDAAPQFDTGSIDVLHIDGFHLAKAVRHDFDSWISKMSDQGIILFHDTNEFRADFGVWRFWRLMREKYPHIEFGHCHGLGVLVVGQNNPLRLPLAGSDFSLLSAEASNLIQALFVNVGRLAWTKVGQASVAPARAASSSAYARTADVEPEIAQMRIDLEKFEKSLYGRVRLWLRMRRLKRREARAQG